VRIYTNFSLLITGNPVHLKRSYKWWPSPSWRWHVHRHILTTAY